MIRFVDVNELMIMQECVMFFTLHVCRLPNVEAFCFVFVFVFA